VVEDGRTGLLFPSGDTGTAARLLADLARNRGRLRGMRDACRAATARRFGVREQARAFADIVERVIARPPRIKDPLPMERWNIARGLKPAWWTSLRVLRERVGVI
jgi:hypothetical protein